MRPTRRTQHDHIRLRGLDALLPVGEYTIHRHGTGLNHILHFRRIVMTYPHQFGVRLVVYVAEQVIHVPKIKIDSGDAPLFAKTHDYVQSCLYSSVARTTLNLALRMPNPQSGR
jgi:hypothetical protein